MKILTLGVYGFEADSFRKALEAADIGVFVDVRRRRGVRGHQYAFANSKRLQALLEELGIPYIHRIELASPESAIHDQDAADHKAHIARHDRDHLTETFREIYQREILDHFDSGAFMASLPGEPKSVLFFCVERWPDACHRSLIAARLANDLQAPVEHIMP